MQLSISFVVFAVARAGLALAVPTNTQETLLVHEDAANDVGHEVLPLPEGMKHRSLSTSGSIENRLNLVFFGDGCK